MSAKFIFWNISLEQYEQFKIFFDFGLPSCLEPILITGNLKLGASIIPHDELPINILHLASKFIKLFLSRFLIIFILSIFFFLVFLILAGNQNHYLGKSNKFYFWTFLMPLLNYPFDNLNL